MTTLCKDTQSCFVMSCLPYRYQYRRVVVRCRRSHPPVNTIDGTAAKQTGQSSSGMHCIAGRVHHSPPQAPAPRPKHSAHRKSLPQAHHASRTQAYRKTNTSGDHSRKGRVRKAARKGDHQSIASRPKAYSKLTTRLSDHHYW